MDDKTKAKAIAAGKIALGAARMASAVVTATGHGFIGAWCRQHHRMMNAWCIARHGMEGGRRQLDEGLAEWDRANS